mgnify:CR=1 FL=1
MSNPQDISINDIRQAVRNTLAECFPDVPVADGAPEAISPPYFIVQLLESGHTQELDRRYLRQYPFLIQYVDPDAGNEERYDVADHLSDALQWIEAAGRPVRGTGMRFRIENDVLLFSVEYRIRVWKPAPNDPMLQTLVSKEGLK